LSALVNAYFLGKFFHSLETQERKNYRAQVTPHYLVIADLTYDLFELRPLQILRTRNLSVQQIRRLKRRVITALREDLEDYFAGAQN
jgi:hypothetical protein